MRLMVHLVIKMVVPIVGLLSLDPVLIPESKLACKIQLMETLLMVEQN